MKLGLHISDFTWDGGAPELRFKLGDIAQRAEDGGFDRISVMDHVWQIGHIGPPEHEMLEAYTALGWLAAKTERVKLLDHGDRRRLPRARPARQGDDHA